MILDEYGHRLLGMGEDRIFMALVHVLLLNLSAACYFTMRDSTVPIINVLQMRNYRICVD